jgi:hypothetical protein
MRVAQVFKAGLTTGGQQPVNVDWLKFPFQVTLDADLVNGLTEYTVEYTTDLMSDSEQRWKSLSPTLNTGTLLTINTAVTGLRLNIASLSGELRATWLQGTSGG